VLWLFFSNRTLPMIYDFDIYLYWMGKCQKQCFARNIGSINMRTHKNYITNKQHKSQVLLMCLLLKTYFRVEPFRSCVLLPSCEEMSSWLPCRWRTYVRIEQWQVWAKCLTHIYVQLCAYAHTCNKYTCVIYIYISHHGQS